MSHRAANSRLPLDSFCGTPEIRTHRSEVSHENREATFREENGPPVPAVGTMTVPRDSERRCSLNSRFRPEAVFRRSTETRSADQVEGPLDRHPGSLIVLPSRRAPALRLRHSRTIARTSRRLRARFTPGDGCSVALVALQFSLSLWKTKTRSPSFRPPTRYDRGRSLKSSRRGTAPATSGRPGA